MAREKREKKVRKTPEWVKTLRQAYSVTREARPLLPILLLAIFVAVMAIGVGIGIAVDRTLYISLMTIPFALIITLFSFSRIAEGAAYAGGGFNVGHMRRGDVVLIPIRVGAGLRLGVNVGYMRISKKQRWRPF